MYSTKNIDKILLSAAMSENTKNRYQYFNGYDAEDVLEHFFTKDFSEAYQAYKQGKIIYRGDRSLEGNTIIGVTPGIRVSQNTSNIYTSLFSGILPSWDEYPKRNSCAVCTNNEDKASRYAGHDIFVIFPKNGTKIGICPTKDIWMSFNVLLKHYQIENLDTFNKMIIGYAEYVLNNPELDIIAMFNTVDTDEIEEVFFDIQYNTQELVDNVIEEIRDDKELMVLSGINNLEELAIREFIDEAALEGHIFEWQNNMFIRDLIKNAYNENIIMWLNQILSPRANGFKLGTIFDIPDGNNELWFSAPYLMISQQYFNELFN